MGFIYMLTFPSEKSYIGQTIRPIEERFKEHPVKSDCVAVYNAIKKFGWEKVEQEWYEVPDEDLNKHEELMVEVLGTLAPDGYNLKEGGGNGKLSEETKRKISETMSGEKNHNYGKTGEKSHMYGKTHTKESKQKMSEAKSGEKNPNYGKTLSVETKKKLSEAMSGEKHHASKKVYQYTLDGTYVDEYGSSEEAARALGKTDGSSISKCARGKQSTAYGFKWSREPPI